MIKNQTELLTALKQVETLDGRIPVYRDTDIRFELVDPADLKPTAKYVIESNLERVNATREALIDRDGTDIYKTPCGSLYEGFLITPPVVEGDEIVDGLHRCYDSLHDGREILVARVTGVSESLPSIGSPISWDQVKRFDHRPSLAGDCRELKHNIVGIPSELRSLFRDFSGLGSTGRRPSQGQNS